MAHSFIKLCKLPCHDKAVIHEEDHLKKKKKNKKAKWLSEETLQRAEEGREAKGKGERERYTQLNAEFQGVARRDKKAFLS